MYTMRLNKSDKTISLRRVTKKLTLTRIGRRGIQGPKGDKGDSGEASNLVTSVNGKQGVVVLNKTDIGLSNVDNTSDLSKPISTLTQAEIDTKADTSSLATVATTGSYDDLSNKPSIPDTSNLVPNTRTVNGHALSSDVTVTKSDVGLSNADNTSDANKPVSTATQTALNLKANTSSLSTVALSGAYNDLTGKPTLGTAAAQNSTAFATAAQGVKADSAVQSVVAGTNVTVDNTDPNNPIVSSSGGGGAPSGPAGGDLDGTYPNPTVPGLATKVETINGDGFIDVDVSDFPTVGLNFVGAETPAFNANKLRDTDISGTLSTGLDDGDLLRYNASNGWEADTLDKTDIGLSNVDNTSDINKPISTATQTALDTKYTIPAGFTAGTVLGKNFGGTDSPVSYSQGTTGFNLVMRDIDGQIPGVTPTDATDLANKQYVDTSITSGATPDATTSVKGKVQLAGDLGGTSSLPTIKRTVRLTVSRDATRLADYYCVGSNDEVQINAAILAANVAGGGTVVILGGTNSYRANGPIVGKENVTVLGERMSRQSSGGVTIKAQAGSSLTSLVTITGTSNPSSNADLIHDTHFENITFDGNNTTTNGVMFTNQDTSKFVNCRFIQVTNPVATTWDSTVAPTAATIPGGIYLIRCNISPASGGIGVDLQDQTQCWITGCWFTPPSGTPTAMMRFKSSNKIYVSGAEFNTAATALLFEDVSTGGAMDFPCNDIEIVAKTFATGGTVIDDNRTHPASGNVRISGTMASGTTIGDKLVGSGNLVAVNDISTPFNVLSQAAADKILTLKGFASQSGRYIEVQNSAATAIAYMNSGGNWYVNNGSTSAVSYGFTSEINTGMYRIGASNLGFSLGGTLHLDLSTTALDVKNKKITNLTDPTSAQDAASKAYVDSGASLYRPGGTDVAVADGGTGASDASGARTNLGLVIGTNVQAWDADLDTWATKTAPSGTVIGTTDTQTLTNKYVKRRVTAITGNAPTFNADNCDVLNVTAITGAINMQTNYTEGTRTSHDTLWVSLTANGAYAITWMTNTESSTLASLPTTTINGTLDIALRWNAATSKFRCVAVS